MWTNTAINESATISGIAGTVITSGAHKAVKYDANGRIVLAGAGDVSIGTLISSTEDPVPVGGDVSIQVKDIGYIVAGSALLKGDPVATGADGVGIKATTGTFILGFALGNADADGHVLIQITKSGYAQ